MATPPDAKSLSFRSGEEAVAPAGRRRWGWWLLALAAVMAAGFFFVQGRTIKVATAPVAKTYPADLLAVLTATGYVVPQKQAAVASKATGRLEWLGVREGSHVKGGEVLARLENDDMKANLAQAQAAVAEARALVAQAEAELTDARRAARRSKELLAKHFVSPATDDAAQARLDKARAGVAAARARVKVAEAAEAAARVALENTFIRAPFDGVVLTKNADVGDVVAPFNANAASKGAVVTLADMGTLEVEADVSESSLFKVHVGQPCEIRIDALGERRLPGEAIRQVPSVDRSKATSTFKVRFLEQDPAVLPDMSARVNFLQRPLGPEERQARVTVPAAALVDEGRAVFAVHEGVARRLPVKVLERLGDMAAIEGGPKLGEPVVLDPPANLADGSRVEVNAGP